MWREKTGTDYVPSLWHYRWISTGWGKTAATMGYDQRNYSCMSQRFTRPEVQWWSQVQKMEMCAPSTKNQKSIQKGLYLRPSLCHPATVSHREYLQSPRQQIWTGLKCCLLVISLYPFLFSLLPVYKRVINFNSWQSRYSKSSSFSQKFHY